MFDETQVVDETQQEVVTEQQEQPESTAEQVKQVETPAQANFRTLREEKERLAKERDEALRIARELQERFSKPQEQEEDYSINIGEEDLTEGKHLKKIDRKYTKELKRRDAELSEMRRKLDEIAVEAKIKSQYSDFDSVVNQDTVSQLRELYPELAETIAAGPDLYKKAASAYTAIKNLGLYKPKDPMAELDKIQISKNQGKPRPLTSIAPQQGDTPLSRANAFANGLTEDLKEQLRKEMFESMRNR